MRLWKIDWGERSLKCHSASYSTIPGRSSGQSRDSGCVQGPHPYWVVGGGPLKYLLLLRYWIPWRHSRHNQERRLSRVPVVALREATGSRPTGWGGRQPVVAKSALSEGKKYSLRGDNTRFFSIPIHTRIPLVTWT